MRNNNERITGRGELSYALIPLRGTIVRLHRPAPREYWVIVYSRAEKDGMADLSIRKIPVDPFPAEEMIRLGYVTDEVEFGSFSATDFVLTRNEILLRRVLLDACRFREEEWQNAHRGHSPDSGTVSAAHVTH